MLNIIKYGNFSPVGKQKKKQQIILAHTYRSHDFYLQSLKNRFNGKHFKIPNYLITKKGDVLQLLKDEEYSNFFVNESINKNSIVICLENLGWLKKEPLKDYYVNWIGDIYKGKVFEKKWREYYFWDVYTESEIQSTTLLCKHLIKEMNIKNNIVGHNTKINGIEKFQGIVTRSNYDLDYTDLSPSFDFEEFLKKLENEQLTR